MDVSLLLKESYKVDMPYPFGDGGEVVTIEYLPLDENRAIRKRHTSITFIKGRRVDVLDDIACSVEIARRCVKGWKGFTAHGMELPCSPENIKMLVRRDYSFAGFVMASCSSLEIMKAVEKERGGREKNSGGTSGSGKTTRACHARPAGTSRKRTG